MKKYLLIPAVIISFCMLAGISGKAAYAAKDKNAKKQTVCPVTGKAIDKKVFVDYKGSRIYFCCSECIKDFNKDPNKYIKKIEASGVKLEKTPSKGEKDAVRLKSRVATQPKK